jgi:carboxyl-terminal processing protease
MKKRLKKIGIIMAIAAIPGFFAFKAADNYFEISKNLEIMSAVVKDVNTYYVDDVDPSKLLHTGIDAMLKSLDPYTDYYSESEVEDYRFMTTGQYGGVGSTISKRGDDIMIMEPYEGWPAQKADLRAGDVILEIDGKSVKGKTTDDVSKMLKGQPNTEVKLLVKRDGVDKPFEKTLVRQEIKVKNVPYYGMINDHIGYIKFIGFRQEAGSEVRDAVTNLKKNNPGLTGIVFDLRDNPGGLLDEAIKTVNIFTDKGQLVVSTKGKLEEWNKQYRTEDEPVDTKIPIVALVDGGSASAAEIVTGSLQDLDRAVIVGSNSYGKGLVQTTRPLPYNTQMKITTSKYYIPSGRCIQAIDYSKGEEGKGVRMADSLKRAFKTKDGRTVYDGTGIRPDVPVARKKYPDIVGSLAEKRLSFDYATKYRAAHPTIPAANKFKLSDADYQDFLTFLKDKSYEYKTSTEEDLKKLEASAKDEEYLNAIKADLDDVEKKLKADKQEDVTKHKDDIKEILEDEIASRYYYQAGRIQASFDDDKDIQEAVKIINDPTRYHNILAGTGK